MSMFLTNISGYKGNCLKDFINIIQICAISKVNCMQTSGINITWDSVTTGNSSPRQKY